MRSRRSWRWPSRVARACRCSPSSAAPRASAASRASPSCASSRRTAATWAELEDYCRLSANPVGELVLGLFGVATPERVAWSDAICTALQLVEHCQDVREDLGRGRIYLPADERAAFGVREEDLRTAPAPEPLRRLLAFEAGRARALLRQGEPLLATLPPLARVCVAGFAAGGHAALDALARGRYDATSRTLAPRRLDTLRHALRLLARSPFRGAAR